MYEGDTPNAERRAAALSLDRDLLRELLGQEELRELIDPDALAARRGRPAAPLGDRRAATGRDEPARRAARARRLTGDGGRRRASSRASTRPAMLGGARARAPRGRVCASAARSAGSPPRTPASTATRSARRPPGGLPDAFLADVPDALRGAGRALRPHPRAVHHRRRCAQRYGVDCGSAVLRELERDGELVRGELRPGGTRARVVRRPRSCAGCGARRWPRCARRSSRPTSARWPPSCRPGRASTATRRPAPGSIGCARCSCRCRGWRCRSRSGSATCCPGAPAPTRTTWLDQLCASGELVWVGAGALGALGPGRALLPRGRRRARPAAGRVEGRAAVRARARAAPRAAGARTPCFFTDLLAEVDLARRRRCARRCGISSGPARRPTTRGRRCARRAWRWPARTGRVARSAGPASGALRARRRRSRAPSPRSRAAGR